MFTPLDFCFFVPMGGVVQPPNYRHTDIPNKNPDKQNNFGGDCFPRDPITLSEDDWGLQSPPQKRYLGSTTILRR